MNPPVLRRVAGWLSRQVWFPPIGRRLVRVDAALQRRSNGRLGLLTLAGLPPLLLTTTGRRSGQPRRVALLSIPDGANHLVVASNWGQKHHPAWSANLIANPAAEVTTGGKTYRVQATLAQGAQRDRLWAVITEAWPAYDTYAARSGRDIRVFSLSPTSAE